MRTCDSRPALSWRLAVNIRSIIGYRTYEASTSIFDVFLDETTVLYLETCFSKYNISSPREIDILVVLRLFDVTFSAFARASYDWPTALPTRDFANRPYRYTWRNMP